MQIFFYKFYKILQKSFYEFMRAECPSIEFWRQHCSTNCLCMKCFWCYFSNQNSWACIQYILYICQLSLVPPPPILKSLYMPIANMEQWRTISPPFCHCPAPNRVGLFFRIFVCIHLLFEFCIKIFKIALFVSISTCI